MTSREERIESAVQALVDDAWQGHSDELVREDLKLIADRVWAVFEQAYTASDDEVNAVALSYWGPSVTYDREKLRSALARVRRTVQGEPTDAEVLAEVREHAQRWADRPPTSPYAMGLRDAWRTILRMIDRLAAGNVREEGQGR